MALCILMLKHGAQNSMAYKANGTSVDQLFVFVIVYYCSYVSCKLYQQ